MDHHSCRPDGDEKYTLKICMVSPLSALDRFSPISPQKAPWYVMFSFDFADGPGYIRKGLWWTTRNLVHEQSLLRCGPKEGDYQFTRLWRIREFPNKPAAKSRWTGTITFHGSTIEILSSFRLQSLKKQHIFAAMTENPSGDINQMFDRDLPAYCVNCIYDDDPTNPWWMWPMESIVEKSWSRMLMRKTAGMLPWLIGLVIIFVMFSTDVCPVI
ncbi:hypothetical protein B0T26DRAFT_735224 [Lasiosphaeria miniovina]|uniref:Uncharacterized protein n=1 Tax=Lasiosphaeria miniovina TaxID=1954250 RepID=A0AA39ZQS7_9PEZI|nr:uncharacterized protein B0T26DRAFT_735224 [Lasiosphaeria miniovina]KAK0701921.1 hypothetical protein B0T26DRAFT_735224 [Lasiosphaeria miniovina]